MKQLLKDPDEFYDPKKRPSGHDIGKAFAKDNGGAIPSNLLQIANSDSNGQYLRGCKSLGVKPHPARFPSKLPEFFIRFLTDPGDLVVDIFSGSNTTGFVAEEEGRHWLALEKEIQYVAASSFRFMDKNIDDESLNTFYKKMMCGESLRIDPTKLSFLEKAFTH